MKKKLTAGERNLKINEQRFSMIIILCNILESDKGVSKHVKSAIAASLINMMDKSMITNEDEPLKNLIDNAIDIFCAQVELENGVDNYKEYLLQTVEQAKELVNEMREKMDRIAEGDNILKGICLN
jgi:hypothetical protein